MWPGGEAKKPSSWMSGNGFFCAKYLFVGAPERDRVRLARVHRARQEADLQQRMRLLQEGVELERAVGHAVAHHVELLGRRRETLRRLVHLHAALRDLLDLGH